MDRQYIDDHHIIARYLADQLPDTEREAFEAYYIEHPETVQEMETVARFKAGLIDLQRQGELDRIIAGRARFQSTQWLAAAAGVAAIAFAITFFVSRAPVGMFATSPVLLSRVEPGSLVVSTPYRVFRTRSSSADAVIEQPKTRQAIAIEILPEYEGAPYRLSVWRVDGADAARVAEIGGLALNDAGFVPVYVDSARITPGLYDLKLTSEQPRSADETSVFSVRVRSTER